MKAMVFCAGFGTRLGDLTRDIPKPMLSLGSAPVLSYLLGHLRRHGFDEIAINLHFKPELIGNHFGNGSAAGLKIRYSLEPSLLGTAGGLKKMEDFFRAEDRFLVQYGDVLTDQDFSAMLSFHRERQALATLLLHQRLGSNSIVKLDDDNHITDLIERPGDRERQGETSPWVNSGICICTPEIFDSIPADTAADLPRDVFPKLIGTGRLYGFPLSGYRCAIDSAARLEEARTAIAEQRCRVTPIG